MHDARDDDSGDLRPNGRPHRLPQSSVVTSDDLRLALGCRPLSLQTSHLDWTDTAEADCPIEDARDRWAFQRRNGNPAPTRRGRS